MTIEEAIARLTGIQGYSNSIHTDNDSKALALGIEALKRIELQRRHYHNPPPYELPGETKED